jgi:hypothetical protein
MNFRSNNTNPQIVAKIVKGKLVSVGHNDEFGGLMGWYYLNTTDAYNFHHSAHLFNALKEIDAADPEFFEFLCKKLSYGPQYKKGISSWSFRQTVKEREVEANHVPTEQNMVVYSTDDNGRITSAPKAVVKIWTTGNTDKDIKKAIKEYNDGKDIGWYTALPVNDEMISEAKAKINEMAAELAFWKRLVG